MNIRYEIKFYSDKTILHRVLCLMQKMWTMIFVLLWIFPTVASQLLQTSKHMFATRIGIKSRSGWTDSAAEFHTKLQSTVCFVVSGEVKRRRCQRQMRAIGIALLARRSSTTPSRRGWRTSFAETAKAGSPTIDFNLVWELARAFEFLYFKTGY